MWYLQSANKSTYNCFQFLIATISKHYGYDYRLIMLELWGFLYDNAENGTIGDKLKLYWNSKIKRRKYLLNYHGLSFDIIAIENLDIENIIHINLLNNPVALYIDSFICPWVPFYQKLHRAHAIFILGEKYGKYIFLDQYSNEQGINKIDKCFVKRAALSIIVFNKNENKSLFNLKCLIKENLDDWKQFGMSNYELFLLDMKNNFNIEKEIVDDPVSSKLIMLLKNIAEDRVNFIEAIELFEEQLIVNLSIIKNHLTDIYVRYEKLRAYIIKCSFSRRSCNIETIINELDNIYLQEQKIYKLMQILTK